MKLPDFEQFEPMNALRKEMGADELGSFEAFDAQYQLTSLEIERLTHEYIEVPFNRVRSLPDGTLAFKNARVLMFQLAQPEDQGAGQFLYHYHLADCRHLQGMTKKRIRSQASVLLGFAVNQSIQHRIQTLLESDGSIEFKPCWECLHALRFDGFDGDKHRKRLHSEQVWRQFQLERFIDKYPQYPLPEELWGK